MNIKVKQKPQYINEALDLVIPQRAQADSSLLFDFLAIKLKSSYKLSEFKT